jgi:hypothetical protein
VEVYRELGMKFDEALDELSKAISDPVERQQKKPRPEDEAAGLAMLQAMVGGSDFKGKARR